MTKKTEETKPLDAAQETPVPATQVKPAEEYEGDKPMAKAPNKGGTAAFDGEQGRIARDATMDADFKGD